MKGEQILQPNVMVTRFENVQYYIPSDNSLFGDEVIPTKTQSLSGRLLGHVEAGASGST